MNLLQISPFSLVCFNHINSNNLLFIFIKNTTSYLTLCDIFLRYNISTYFILFTYMLLPYILFSDEIFL